MEFDPKYIQNDIGFFEKYTLLRIIDIILHQIFLSEIPRASVNPQAPVAQKKADEVVFRHFQGEIHTVVEFL